MFLRIANQNFLYDKSFWAIKIILMNLVLLLLSFIFYKSLNFLNFKRLQ